MNNESYKVLGLLFTDGILSWLQNILAFSVMSMVTSLTYAVASSSKRIFVVAASLFLLGNPVTINNIGGMALALFGVLAYNKVCLFYNYWSQLIFANTINLFILGKI